MDQKVGDIVIRVGLAHCEVNWKDEGVSGRC